MRMSQVMHTIPDDAPFVFQFNNDKSFYDIFNGDKLFVSLIGKPQLGQLDTLRQQLQENPLLEKYFTGQNLFISVHPSKTNDIDLLLTLSAASGFDGSLFGQLAKQANSGMSVTPMHLRDKTGYDININLLKKHFYIINTEDNIFSGSFSKELIERCAADKNKKKEQSFVLLSEKQNANSLASLYVNYNRLSPLFDQLFRNKNTDVFKSLRLLPGLAALTQNYRTDALMFSGITNIQRNEPASYLTLFAGQQPVVNHLKDIFPSTTAYSINFSVSKPLKFAADLSNWQDKGGFKVERGKLFEKVDAETGENIKTAFDKLLANEFAIITTRYFEKFAFITVNDGSKLKSLMTVVSKMMDENTGQLNYEKLPFFLLGDAFSVFRRPYFMVIDNYLILANSTGELKSFKDIYINRKFLSQNDKYEQFDNLLAERSNVAFFFHLKNALPVLERDMYPKIYDDIKKKEPGWQDFYGISVQLTATDNNYYTNCCVKLSTDTTDVKLSK